MDSCLQPLRFLFAIPNHSVKGKNCPEAPTYVPFKKYDLSRCGKQAIQGLLASQPSILRQYCTRCRPCLSWPQEIDAILSATVLIEGANRNLAASLRVFSFKNLLQKFFVSFE